VTAATVAAADVYYLGIRARYPQKFDHAVAMLGPDALPDWPTDLGVPIEQVADPAFHLLYVASRQLTRGLVQEALFTIRKSLATLRNPGYALAEELPAVSVSAKAVAIGDDGYRERLRDVLAQASQRLLTSSDRDQDGALERDLKEIWEVLGE
jgi:hypothetical protein